jgi:hypothetical protein
VYSLHPLQNRWYNSHHANECVDVEHEEKSLDYRPLMNVIIQCETNSPGMSMSVKVPECIFPSENRGVEVNPLAISDDQETFMYSHDRQ